MRCFCLREVAAVHTTDHLAYLPVSRPSTGVRRDSLPTEGSVQAQAPRQPPSPAATSARLGAPRPPPPNAPTRHGSRADCYAFVARGYLDTCGSCTSVVTNSTSGTRCGGCAERRWCGNILFPASRYRGRV
ncbi:hypothetical protein DAEQUDRAFT_409545 [Daedalea quercina L-15889]|uniref:Uncharacterized protein n=1 Tax=Daedalea quercina L-15889 TaxID=1314783 RepID=A0A165NK96_9APHY|nr:hypothetical protein DAEQUDRAFT_409545 [Daedalea quercina L-15889]